MFEDVIVIGGGPTGAACALHTRRSGLRTLLLEAARLAPALLEPLEASGVRWVPGFEVCSVVPCDRHAAWEVSGGGRTHAARRVVVATGARPGSTQARVPAGLALPTRDGYVDVNRHGAVPGFPGIFATGDVTGCCRDGATSAQAHGMRIARSIRIELQVAAWAGSGASAPDPLRGQSLS